LTEEQPDVLNCVQCGKPFAVLRDGVLRIQSVHRGEKHYNEITLEQIQELLGEPENKRHQS